MKRFLLFYLLWIGVFFLLLDAPFVERHFDFERLHVELTMFFGSGLIDLVGIPNTPEGIFLLLPHHTLAIVFGCNGLESIIIFLSGILAYPGVRWKTRLLWMGMGYGVLFVINIFRIALLAVVIEEYNPWFDLMHTYVTQSVMIFLAFLLFIVYVQSQKRAGERG